MKWLWSLLRSWGVSVTVDLPSGYKTPMKPQTILHPSPNFREANGRAVTCIVLHATATPGLQSPLAWLCDPKSEVSAHYLIDTNGDIYHLVLDNNIAWHAGISEWKGRESVNSFSVGIEMVNDNTGHMPYPEAQVAACEAVVRYLMDEYGIAAEDVVRHADVAPGRKNDPLGFDMIGFRGRIT